MKKSVSIIASLMLIGTSFSAVAASDDEPSKRPVAIERQTTHVSRDYVRPTLVVDDIVEAKRAMQESLEDQRIAAEKKREKERAERAAAREAAHKKAEAERAEKARQQKREQQKNKVPAPREKTYSEPTGGIKGYAARLVGQSQFGCLNNLFNRESGWNPYAANPSSGAYGIPQALPGSKMASAGSDWRTNPYTQVRWGVSYIKSRYGTPCSAWAHSQSVGWY
ncbi:glycosyltransferase [Streptomyces phage Circinus]|uniref:Glycosyltransferase n=1 Tax=Streptomyces phage Circinus TaxID=2562189 RepID=A0A4D6E0Z7_9CAUD|nr:glycosyltransferase [Streptomyces phage Circinus]